MKCTQCGHETLGNFCERCGNPMQPQQNPYGRLNSVLIDSNERVGAVLGNNALTQFITTGELGNGFAILSDKRVYFKGTCFAREGKRFYSQAANRTVDLKDVTGTGYVYHSATGAKVFAVICFVVSAVLSIMGGIGLTTIACAALASIFFIVGTVRSYSVFEIAFAGGGIAFDVSWITAQETDTFQRQLILFKELATKTPAVVHTHGISAPQQLKEYKELWDQGVISQQDFEKKKQELLGGIYQ